LIVAGVMSGTSADGIDVSIARISGKRFDLSVNLIGHEHFPYPKRVRAAVLRAMDAASIKVAELSRLNFLLGELYAEAIVKTQQRTKTGKLDLVGCHGQTLFHQGAPAVYLGKKISCTWQTGEGAIIAARLKTPIVSDFRPADMAAGGKGAPLVPFLDYVIFRNRRTGRIVQNVGGIANLTAMPSAAKPEQVLAFDTGPGNMVIDQLMQILFERPYDRDGEIARRGRALQPVLTRLLKQPFFHEEPPKTAGREQFGAAYVKAFLRQCGKAGREDVIATATALTVHSIVEALKRFVSSKGDFRDYIVSGGGTGNRTMMRMLESETAKLGLRLGYTDDFGIPSQAKEALAFAVLAYQTWHRQPGNIPSATGANQPAILGKISYA
jgi:anhydro-N-acetylmuramic acid kinase